MLLSYGEPQTRNDMPNLRPISVRVGPRERKLLEAAADTVRTNLSDYIRRKSVEAAEIDLLDRAIVTIPAASWGKFETWAKRPAKNVKGLRDLAKTRFAWHD